MKKKLIALLSIAMVISLALPGTVSATRQDAPAAGPFTPGQITTFKQTIPINFVFIGYKPSDINTTDFSQWLPAAYKPIVRYPTFYGLPGRDMGLQYNFSYRYIYKDNTFARNFFFYLRSIGRQGDLTYHQEAYNAMANNYVDVNGPVLYIDGPSVEKWLANQLKLGERGYTLVFINWYNRPDFKFHVYTKTNEPDFDTLFNFGDELSSRKTIAWGGGDKRLWFYDLSAGPEAWSGNYDVDNADLDGDSIPDYRMPPIWEYAAGGYRAPSELSSDLGMVSRFVAINLLFTGSPLYDPMNTVPKLHGRKVVHINMMEDDPASLGVNYAKPSFVFNRFKQFQPYYNWVAKMADKKPIDANARRAFRIWTGLDSSNDCWNGYGDPFAELFCFFKANRAAYVPSYVPGDYVAPIHVFNTTAANMGSQFGLLGFADDNWVNGRQSYVFVFGGDLYRAMGYGFTSTIIHEGGHHFGLSHPHDGYDYEYDINYGSEGSLYFAWSGDESATVMSYMDLTTEFGRFNKDNLYRWETAGYLNWSNMLLADLMAHPKYASVKKYVAKAESHASIALRAFRGWNYEMSASQARQAYRQLVIAARALRTPTPDVMPAAEMQIGNANFPREGDPIRFPDN